MKHERRRVDTLVLLLLVIGMLASTPWLVSRWYIAHNDAAMFVVTARSLLAGDGYRMLGEPFTIRPPGFSALLAVPMAAVGTDVHVLNLCIAVSGIVGVAFLFVLVRPRIGLAPTAALCAAVWLAPGYLRFSTMLLSDVPGTAMMLGLLVLERRARRSARGGLDALFAVGVGLASLVRLINVFLVPATLVARLFEERRERGRWPPLRDAFWRRWVLLAVLPMLVLLPWMLRNAAVEQDGPPEQHYVHSYSTGMWHSDGADPASPLIGPAEFAERVGARWSELLPSLGARLQDVDPEDPDGNRTEKVLGVVMLGCCALVLARRREPMDFVVFAVVAILVVYFAYQRRLAIPILMLGLAAAADATLAGFRLFLPERAAGAVVALGIVALAVHDFRSPDWSVARFQHEQLQAAADHMDRLSPQVTLSARQGWHLSVLAERPVYSAHIVQRRDGVRPTVRMLDRNGVDVFVFQHGAGSRDLKLWNEGLRRFYDVRTEHRGWSFAWRNTRRAGSGAGGD